MPTPTKKPARPATPAERGQLGGRMRTPAKSRAARENGKRGGRPKKKRIPRPPYLVDVAKMVMELRGDNRAFAHGATTLARWVMT